MAYKKQKTKTKRKFIHLSLYMIILSMLGFSTVSINQSYAAQVHPTIIKSTTAVESKNSFTLGEIFAKFINFVKEGVEKNNAKYKDNTKIISDQGEPKISKKVDFDIKQQTNNLLNKFNHKTYFEDIDKNTNKTYINYLAQTKIISQKYTKFYPNNFMRLHEFCKLLVNGYRYKLGYNLDKNIGLTNKNYFSNTLPKYYNTAYEMGLLNGVDQIEDFERFISYEDVQKILSNLQQQYPEITNSDYIQNIDIDHNNKTLKRGELSRVVVKSLNLQSDINPTQQTVFGDISSSEYKDSIETLAKLDIIDTNQDKFLPENRITRGEFTNMVIQTYLKVNNLELSISNFNFNIDDLDYNSKYAPIIVYAQENGFTDYFFETKRGKTYFEMNKAVTKHEAYHIVSQIAGVQINYDITQADKEYITRGEVADLLVNSFDLNTMSHTTNSQIETFVENIKSLTETKKLLSFLF